MAWITVPGLAGKVYAPDDAAPHRKKHPCKTCFACQWCDEARCQVCHAGRKNKKGRPSADEYGCGCPSKP